MNKIANVTSFELKQQLKVFYKMGGMACDVQYLLTAKPATVNTEFGDAFHCVGFFSAPIWSGLFVVFILLAITFYGIMMMMDIRTMDRFDDPKGKTITINAAE